MDKNVVFKDRLNVIGYDYNIYYNCNYINYEFNKKEKVLFSNIIIIFFNRLWVDDIDYENEVGKIRFLNL